MVASLLIEFLLHTIGWVVPLSLLFDASMRFAHDEQSPTGLWRIFLGGTLALLAMLFSILYLTVFHASSIELHLISHGTILLGFLLALFGARTALAKVIHPPTPDSKQTVTRRPFLAIPALLVLLVLAEGLVSRAEPLWLLDRVLYALNLSLLAALYASFGVLTKRETGSAVVTALSVVAAACAVLAIAAHSVMIMDVSPPLKAAAQVGRGALLALGAVAIIIAYRFWLARSARLQPADSMLLKPKLQLQQRLALFITVGAVLFAAGAVIMSDIIRSSIQTVEQTYLQDQERVARAVARNFESLTTDLVMTLSRFAAQPAVQRMRVDSLRLLFSREFPRWQRVVSFFSRVDEHGILRYTYPEVASSIGADLTTQQHVQEFLRTRQITLSGVFRTVQGFNAIALYVPVFRTISSNDSVFAGGVALLVHTDAFSERAFRNVQYLNPNPVAAVNLTGNVIASSDSELVGTSAQQYLKTVFPLPVPDDTVAHVVRRALELTTPGVLPLAVAEALTARRWIIAYPIHLDGTRVGSILLTIRQADVVSLYRSSIVKQVVWWMVITALLILTMGSIAVVVYRWAAYLESEVRRTVALVREREERLQTIIDTEPECVKILDPEGRILEMNRAGLQMIEAEPLASVQGKSVYSLVAPEYRERFRQLMRNVFEERSGTLEFEIVGLRGTRRWLDTHMVPLRDASGHVVAALGITRDITERKRVEEQLQRSHEWLNSIFEASRDGIIVEENEQIVYVNRAAVQLYGYSDPQELIGQHVSLLQSDEDNERMLEYGRRRKRDEPAPTLYEFKGRRKDGSFFDCEISVSRAAIGGQTLIIGVLRDVTERKRAESLRLRLSQVLESIASDEALPQILERLVLAIEEFVPDMKGSVLLLDAVGKRLLHGSAPNLPDDYNRAIDGLLIGPRVGSCGTAAYEKRLVIVEDIQTDPLWADYRDLATKHGLRACWSQPIIDRDGTVLGTFALYYDKPRKPTDAELELITTAANIAGIAIKRKRAEEALRQSELRYRTVIANAPVVLWALDREGRFTFSEGKRLERLGLKPGEVVGRSVFEVYRDFPEIVHNNRQALEGKTVTTVVELAGLSFETHHAPLYGDGGEVIGAMGLAIDITERKQAEDALRASEQRYRELFEESKDAVYISTPEGRFIDINPAGVELFGYSSREEMLKVDIVRDLYVNPADREQYLKALEEQGSVKDHELHLRKRTGEEIIVLETATAVRDSAGRVVALRGILRDVTLQRKLENEIRQAQKMESIGVLAGGIAHDFNNILGGILGYASYLKMKMTEEHPFYKHLETIERSALRAADLTSKLLAFARGGRYEVKPVNLNTIVNETVGLLERSLDKTITIEVVLDPHLPTVEADPGQLHQVLMNLCVNAKDAMPGGGKLLIETTHALLDEEFARTWVEARPGHFVILSVTDTGIGMDKETLLRIFDPFFTTKEKGKGTGLGLSMVYGIVKAHNGFIRVYSELGQGSTFRVYLPASDKPTEEAVHTPAEVEGGTETILVVDDEEFVRELAEEVLGSAGYKVLTAADGEEALQIYQAHGSSIDLVLLDMIMPKMNGRETFAKLREVNPRVKVLLSTGYTQNGTAREILDSGAVGFLQKPYRSHELLRKVRAVLDQERSGM